MKDLNLYTGGHPFKIDDILHLQTGIKEALDHITLHFQDGVTTPYRLYGAEITEPLPNSFTVTAGAIYYNGEIYTVVAAVGLTNVGNDILDFDWIIQTTYAAPSPVTYQDASVQNVHTIKTVVLIDNNGTPGSTGFFGPASTLPTITSALNTDNIGAPAIAWDDATALSGINAGSTLTDYIQYILDAIGVLNGVVQSQYGAPHEFKAQITPIAGSMMPEVFVMHDLSALLALANNDGSPFQMLASLDGVKTFNTLHFNDTVAAGMYDNGNNWFGNKYVVPVAGTYNFFVEDLTLGSTSNFDFAGQNSGTNYLNKGILTNFLGPHASNLITMNHKEALGLNNFPASQSLDDNTGQLAGFNMNLIVRRPGAGQILALYDAAQMAGVFRDYTNYFFQVVQTAPGEYQSYSYVAGFNTLGLSMYADQSPSIYDPVLGLTLEQGDEVYFGLTHWSTAVEFSCVPVSGYAYCEKTS